MKSLKIITLITIPLMLSSLSFAGSRCNHGIAASPVSNLSATTGDTNNTSNSASTADSYSNSASQSSTGPVSQSNTYHNQREYPGTPNTEYGPTRDYTAQNEMPGYGFMDLRQRLAGRTWFTRDALKNLSSGCKMVGGYRVVNEGSTYSHDYKWMHIVFIDDLSIYPGINKSLIDGKRDVDLNGYAEGQTSKYGTTLLMLFGELAGQAMDAGCNVFVVSKAAYDNANASNGGGIGFAAVRASDSGVGAGGTGYAFSDSWQYARSSLYGVGIIDNRIQPPKK
jgi:hypothetical protein